MPKGYEALIFVFAPFLVAVLLTPVMIVVSKARGWYDAPGERKIHKDPIPRLGGVGIFCATWAGWLIFTQRFSDSIPVEAVQPLWAFFIASTLVFLLGVYDDLWGANAYKKLTVQLIAAVIVVAHGFKISLVYNPFGTGDIVPNEFLSWTLSILWIVVVTNAINLIDGLDGLACGVCLITSLSIFFISKALGVPHLPYFALAMSGACLGFLIFNFSPARIFLGDSGSLFSGFALACLSLLGSVKRSTAIVMFGPPLILALPVADTLLAVFRRLLKKQDGVTLSWAQIVARLKEVFEADQEHIHHGLIRIGLSHRRAVMILYVVTGVLGLTAYQGAVKERLLSTILILLLPAGGLFWLLRKVKKVSKVAEQAESKLAQPRPRT